MTRSTETGSRATGTGSSATDDVTDDVSKLFFNPYLFATHVFVLVSIAIVTLPILSREQVRTASRAY